MKEKYFDKVQKLITSLPQPIHESVVDELEGFERMDVWFDNPGIQAIQEIDPSRIEIYNQHTFINKNGEKIHTICLSVNQLSYISNISQSEKNDDFFLFIALDEDRNMLGGKFAFLCIDGEEIYLDRSFISVNTPNRQVATSLEISYENTMRRLANEKEDKVLFDFAKDYNGVIYTRWQNLKEKYPHEYSAQVITRVLEKRRPAWEVLYESGGRFGFMWEEEKRGEHIVRNGTRTLNALALGPARGTFLLDLRTTTPNADAVYSIKQLDSHEAFLVQDALEILKNTKEYCDRNGTAEAIIARRTKNNQ